MKLKGLVYRVTVLQVKQLNLFKNNASFSLQGFGDHIEWRTYSEGLKEAQSR